MYPDPAVARMSFICVFMVVLINDSDVLIEAEDRAREQERLRHVIEQPTRHVVDLDNLIRHECDTAHDEQHRTGVLRDFEALVVFHGIVKLLIFSELSKLRSLFYSYFMLNYAGAPSLAKL